MKHESVLLQEAIKGLAIKEQGVYVDATLGGGGHSEKILNFIPKGHLYAFDQDDFALSYAKERLHNYSNITYIKDNFRHMEEQLSSFGIHKVDGILFDLGVSSFQFDIPDRGFSYNFDSPLDMRMNQNQSLTAYELVNEAPHPELLRILFRYGEETNAKMIVNGILRARTIAPIKTTFDLVNVIKSSLPQKILKQKGHPAKQTFQALRIAVNDELKAFEEALIQAIKLIKSGGRIVVITFHSLEDRICKTIFKEHATINIPKGLPIIITEKPLLRLINSHVILPSEEELEMNNRAHSAKMRIVEKN
jgi:16S rRNA (cytosine1402-N4)-methyltransferase